MHFLPLPLPLPVGGEGTGGAAAVEVTSPAGVGGESYTGRMLADAADTVVVMTLGAGILIGDGGAPFSGRFDTGDVVAGEGKVEEDAPEPDPRLVTGSLTGSGWTAGVGVLVVGWGLELELGAGAGAGAGTGVTGASTKMSFCAPAESHVSAPRLRKEACSQRLDLKAYHL